MLLKNIKKNEPILHVLFWMCYVLFPYFKSIGRTTVYNFYSELNDLLFGMFVFYISYYLFIKLLNKLSTFLYLLLLFCGVGYVNLKTHNWFFQGSHNEAFWYYSINYISTYSILVLLGYVLFLIKKEYQSQQLLEKMNSEKKEAELASLKSQINPHFLFNTLNSIYSSALRMEENTADLILKLSNNFRYVLQDGQQESVPLKKEISHIRDYLSLQKERLPKKINIEFELSIDDYEATISPLLLISFVENAIKYTSTLRGDNHLIKIAIELELNSFRFYCRNPYLNAEKNINKEVLSNGIGIENTRKRLEHLYPSKHLLAIANEKDSFSVELKIEL